MVALIVDSLIVRFICSNITAMIFDHRTFKSFLKAKDENELLARSLEIERKLINSFAARPSGGLLEKISTSWGLSPLLQMELFILASILDRVVNDNSYDLTPIRRRRFILAFERSIREMEELQKKQDQYTPGKKIVDGAKEPAKEESVFIKAFYALIEYCKCCLMNILFDDQSPCLGSEKDLTMFWCSFIRKVTD